MNATRNFPWGAAAVATFRLAPAGVWLAALCLVLGVEVGFGSDPDAQMLRRRAESAFGEARDRYSVSTNEVESAWQFGRAAFDFAEFATSTQERRMIASEGVAACRRAVHLQPDLAAGHYYLGLNLGQLARVVNRLSALGLVGDMEEAFVTARRCDPEFDYAGADRNLGLLYQQAPGWPISVGNKASARKHLEAAVSLSPDYPGNRLALARLRWATDKRRLFLSEMEALAASWPRAQAQFSGDEWIGSWIEWKQGLLELQQHAASITDASGSRDDD